jgi:hypothetical protein
MKSFYHYQAVRADAEPVLKEFSRATYEASGALTYAYTAGYYESAICELLAELPKAKREAFIRRLKESIAK